MKADERGNLIGLSGDNLAKHDSVVAVKEGDAGKTLALGEGVDDQRLDGLENDLGSLIGFEGVRVRKLLTSGLLANLNPKFTKQKQNCSTETNLPVELGDFAGRTSTANETDRGVTDLDFRRNVEGLNLGREVLAWAQAVVRLEDHDVTDTGHTVLLETLDVEADVVTGRRLLDTLVVLLNGEHLALTRVSGGVRRHEDNFLVLGNGSLLDTPGKNITDTLDLVDTRNRKTESGVVVALGQTGEVVESVKKSDDLVLVTLDVNDLNTVPPGHVGRFLEEVVSHPTRDGKDRNRLVNELLLPSTLDKHAAHLVADLNVTLLLVSGNVSVHLVDTDNELLDTEQVDEPGVLTSLTLDLSLLAVASGNGGGEVAISRHHEKRNIGLSGSGNHVLDKVLHKI